MEKSLGEFVIKFLQDKTQTRKIIKCDDFFQLIEDMGITDESDEVIGIINYLEENNTDINFHGANTQNFYTRFRNIERKVQMTKMLKGSKPEVQKLIEKVESVTVKERPDWLEMYRNDDEDESPVAYTDKDNNLGKSILDRLTNEIREKIENEPKVTIEEIQEEIENKITYQENPIMGQMNGEELRDFLSNRIIPERFRENNNNNNN
jgi:hypothetical protein